MKARKNSGSRRSRVALVTCVRNEARFLAAHLLYHREIGIERAYVFLDRCSDGTAEIAVSFSWVRAVRVNPDDAVRFPYVPDLQRVCMDRALEMAREEGIDWLLGIDVDEYFAAGSVKPRIRRGFVCTDTPDLPAMLGRLPASTETVRIYPQEILPVDVQPGGPIWSQRVFLRKRYHTRETMDPITGEVFTWIGLLGHHQGKSIVRTSADVQAVDAHGWTRNQGTEYPCRPPYFRLKERALGRLLHYVVVDSEHWYEKHRKLSHEPAKWRGGGSVEGTKQCWKNAASQMSLEDAGEYFRRWVATPDWRVNELLALGEVFIDESVETSMRRASLLVGDQLQVPYGNFGSIEDWRLTPQFWIRAERETGIIQGPDGALELNIAELAPAALDGFKPQQFDGKDAFMPSHPECRIRFELEPGRYLLTLRLAKPVPWNRLRLSLDGRGLPASRRRVAPRQAIYELYPDDFRAGCKHELQLARAASRYVRLLARRDQGGVPLIGLSFQPRFQSKAAA